LTYKYRAIIKEERVLQLAIAVINGKIRALYAAAIGQA
jgi:hypothetical protein